MFLRGFLPAFGCLALRTDQVHPVNLALHRLNSSGPSDSKITLGGRELASIEWIFRQNVNDQRHNVYLQFSHLPCWTLHTPEPAPVEALRPERIGDPLLEGLNVLVVPATHGTEQIEFVFAFPRFQPTCVPGRSGI